MRRALPLLIIAAVLVVAVGAGWLLYRNRMEPEPQPTPSPVAATPKVPTSTPAAPVSPAQSPTPAAVVTPATAGPNFNYGRPGAEPMHIRGNPAAPAVLEEFGDFECLPCSKLFPVLETLEKEFGDRLVVVFREHPLRMHKFALDAARAAEAAGFQGKFWEMHDMLYRNRGTWVPAAYVRPYLNEYATALQLDLDRFKEDMDAKKVADRIVADQARGDSLGIDRTPVVFVNGEKIPVVDINEKGLRAAIEKALAPKGP